MNWSKNYTDGPHVNRNEVQEYYMKNNSCFWSQYVLITVPSTRALLELVVVIPMGVYVL